MTRFFGLLSCVAIIFGSGSVAYSQDAPKAGDLIQLVTLANASHICELLADAGGQIEALDIKTGRTQRFSRDEVKKLTRYQENAAIQVVGLPSFIAWKVVKATAKEMPSGAVAKLDNAIIYVSMGKQLGIAVGDQLRVYRGEAEVKDPVSGEVLGKQRRRISDLEVVEVQEKYCKAKQVGDLEIALEVGDRVEPAKFNNAIAVLPFSTLNDDASGVILSEHLTTALAQREVPVVERTLLVKALTELAIQQTAVFDSASAKAIGRQVGAGAILTGSIAPSGNQSSINVRLIEVETGKIRFSMTTKFKDLPSVVGGGSGAAIVASASGTGGLSGGRVVSKGATYTVSSRYEGIKPLDSLLSDDDDAYSSPGGVSGSARGKGGFWAFTTGNEPGAHIVIDLGRACVIEGLHIANGNETPAATARAKDLTIWVSSEAGSRGTKVWTTSKGEKEYRATFSRPAKGRYVTIGFPDDKSEYLHLKKVKVFGQPVE
ncbi:MAG TPA: FlgO family outer membrane protein [Pirellulaceae bacterium]|nr:FlgO family outer membrane protein [Pirellulaceae bacterium]